MRIRILFLIFLSFYSVCASSQLVSYVTGMRSEDHSAYWGYLYDFTLKKDGDLSKLANPCYQVNICNYAVGIGFPEDANGGIADQGFIDHGGSCNSSAATVEELLNCLNGKTIENQSSVPDVKMPSTFSLPLSATFWMRYGASSGKGKACIGLAYGTGRGGGDFQFLPGTLCSGGLPVPDSYCKLPSTINLDHGLVSSEDVNASTVEKTIDINCSSNVNLNIGLQGSSDGTLLLGGEDVVSTIYIDNIKMNDGGISKNFQSGINTISIKSVLSTKSKPATGKYVGQGVLVLAFP